MSGAGHHAAFALCSDYGDCAVELHGGKTQRETHLHLLVDIACYGVSHLHATSMQPHPAGHDISFCTVMPELAQLFPNLA